VAKTQFQPPLWSPQGLLNCSIFDALSPHCIHFLQATCPMVKANYDHLPHCPMATHFWEDLLYGPKINKASHDSHTSKNIPLNILPYGGFLKWWYPKMDGLQWTILLKLMIWDYPHFRKHPYIPMIGCFTTRILYP
jgi:hypothetical protein